MTRTLSMIYIRTLFFVFLYFSLSLSLSFFYVMIIIKYLIPCFSLSPKENKYSHDKSA